MADVTIEIEGLKELVEKMDKLPDEVQKAMNKTMFASLDVLHSNVPPYISQVVPPEVYRRTVTLGRSLGSGTSGGKVGTPTVYSVRGTGKDTVGEFGTNLSYAPYVIGPPDAPKGERQAYMHKPGYKGRPGWWTMKDIKEKSEVKIHQLWDATIGAIIRKLGL